MNGQHTHDGDPQEPSECPGCGETWDTDDSDADDPSGYCSADCERRDRAALRSRGEGA